MYNVSTNLLARFTMLFGLHDVFHSLVVAEMFNALTEEMFRSEVGLGLPGKANSQRPANWHNLRRSQRASGLRGAQSGFSLLGPQQVSAPAEDPGCWGVSLVEL